MLHPPTQFTFITAELEIRSYAAVALREKPKKNIGWVLNSS